MVKVLLSDAVERFLRWARTALHPGTEAVYRLYLRRFAKWRGNVEVTRVTPADLLAWSRKFHPVQAVQRLYGWMKREARMIDANPLEGMRKPRTGQRRRVLTRGERVALMRFAGPQFRLFVVALVETMARPGELRGAKWTHVRTSGNRPFTLADLRAGRCFLFLDRFKARERRADAAALRVIPLTPRLGRLLARLFNRPVAMDGPIFVNSKGRAWTVNAVRCQLRRLRRRAGVELDGRGESVVAYSFRHTGATDAVRAGVRDFTLAELLGHTSPRTTMRYVHLSPDDLAAALKRAKERRIRDGFEK